MPYLPHLSRIDSPSAFRLMERFLLSVDTYFKGSIELGTWKSQGLAKPLYNTKANTMSSANLHNSVLTAYGLFQSGDMGGTRRALALASACITPAVTNEEPILWPHLCILLFRLKRWGWMEVYKAIIFQCSEIAKLLYSTHHPLPQVFEFLAALNPREAVYATKLGWRKALGALQGSLGSMHWNVVKGTLSFHIHCTPDTEHHNKTPIIKDLVHTVDQSCSQSDSRSLIAHTYFAYHLGIAGFHSKAVEECKILLRRLDQFVMHEENGFLKNILPRCRLSVTQTLACCFDALQNVTEALRYHEEASQLNMTLNGLSDPRSVRSLVRLESYLDKSKRYSALDEMRARRIRAQKALNSKLAAEEKDVKLWRRDAKMTPTSAQEDLEERYIHCPVGRDKSNLGESVNRTEAELREDIAFAEELSADVSLPESAQPEPRCSIRYDRPVRLSDLFENWI